MNSSEAGNEAILLWEKLARSSRTNSLRHAGTSVSWFALQISRTREFKLFVDVNAFDSALAFVSYTYLLMSGRLVKLGRELRYGSRVAL